MKKYVFDESKSKHEAFSKDESMDAIAISVRNAMVETTLMLTNDLPITDLARKFMNATFKTYPNDTDGKYIYSGFVSDFTEMFEGCVNLTDIKYLNTANGTNFFAMFRNCSAITALPAFDTRRGKNFHGMFDGCSTLYQLADLDLRSMYDNAFYCRDMFKNCTRLKHFSNNPYLDDGVTPWQFRRSIDFGDCPLFTSAIKKVFNGLREVSTQETITISATTNSDLLPEDRAIATNKGWIISVRS